MKYIYLARKSKIKKKIGATMVVVVDFFKKVQGYFKTRMSLISF